MQSSAHAGAGSFAQSLSGPHDQIVVGKLSGKGPTDAERQRTGILRLEQVPIGAEGENGLNPMPPVRQLAAHVQRQIELGWRRFRVSGQRAAVACVSPTSIFDWIRP